MAFLSRNKNKGSVGLDVDGRYVAAVRLEGGRVERAASSDLPSGVVADGEVSDEAALAQALKDLFRRNDLPRAVRLGVANQQIVVRRVDLPLVPDERERDMAIRFQAAEAIAMPLDEAVLDYQIVGESADDDGASRMQVVIVAARKAMVARFIDAVRSAGLRPAGLDLNAFALVRALGSDSADGGDGRVYCHLGGVTNLAIAVGRSCLFTRPLSTTWNGDAAQSASALADEIRLSIDYYMTQPAARPVADVVLSGPGSVDEEAVGEFAASIGLPVSVAEPLGGRDDAGVPEGDDRSRYTVATGLALGEAA